MNRTNNFINLFVVKGRDGTIIQWKISSLVILALLVSLVALGIYAGFSAIDAATTRASTIVAASPLSENPELKVIQRYAEWSLANPWAVNPELKYVQRYSRSVSERTQASYAGSSPELNLHQRFIEASRQAEALAFRYANPEVKIHQRLVELNQEQLSAGYLAQNPELKVDRRFAESEK